MSQNNTFIFSADNFIDPKLPSGLDIHDLDLVTASDETLQGYGYLVHNPNDFTTDNGRFEIVKWPQLGWRPLDPNTGDEAGTTEGNFEVHWKGDFYFGKNLAVATSSNTYLDGIAALPEVASMDDSSCRGEANTIYLWMSDYHPDGGQLFWPSTPVPFAVALGLSTYGDDIAPQHMRAFAVPAGCGVYIHPGTWHNGVYVAKEYCPMTFFTRQGKVHARISASWAAEFKVLLRVRLPTSSPVTFHHGESHHDSEH